MNRTIRLIPRIALFSALIYVLSLGTSYLPNVNLVFFIVFFAGAAWGAIPGILVGVIGMGIWTIFNPYGPATIPVTIAQVVGTSISGLVGAEIRAQGWLDQNRGVMPSVILASSAILCTVGFYLPVNLVDAWVFQPFWPRFIAGSLWSLISLVSNMLIFPLLFHALKGLYVRESRLT
jgi:uncharacterized membrane protein